MAPFGKLLLTVPAIIVLCGASDERGNIVCSIDDQNLKFSAHARFGYRGDKPLFGVEGVLDLKPPGSRIGTERLAIKDEHLIQQWFYDTDLRLQFNIPAADGSVSLALLTSQTEDGLTYQGTYDLEIRPPDAAEENSVLLDGKVTCTMD